MINLQTKFHGAFLGDGGWKDQIHREILMRMCVGDECMLSEDERVTDFAILHPREAWVEDSLRKVIAEAGRTLVSGQRLVLVRWKDDTESLVVFPTSDAFPSEKLLMAAYIGGFVTQVARVGVDDLWDAP